MKKLITIALMALITTGCSIFGRSVDDATPKTRVENSIRMPAKHISPVAQTAFKVLLVAIEKGVITEPDQVAAVMNSYTDLFGEKWYANVFGRNMATIRFAYSSPKSVEAKLIDVSYSPETASFNGRFEELKAFTDPVLVVNVGEAQAAITTAEGEAGAKQLEHLSGIATGIVDSVVSGGLSNAKDKIVKPKVEIPVPVNE